MKPMKTQKRHIRNSALFAISDEPTEGGMVVTARLKVWGKQNLNNETYEPTAYDDFIKNYYERGGLNMPLTVQHGNRVEDIIGRILAIDKDEEGLTVKAQIMDGLPMSETVKALIKAGVLQGMSDEGFADDYDYTAEEGFRIKHAAMLAVSLVATPAEAVAKISINNAINVSGFGGSGRLRRRKNNG